MAWAPAQVLVPGDFLAQLERLTLVSRRTFRGRVKGERRSPRKGISPEFCDYRPYGAGDDLRYVDWNIYGRLGRLHLKLFVEEEDLCLHLLLDASASMDYGEPSKFDYAVRLAAALGFVGLVNLERVGVGVVRQRVAEGWPPMRGRNQFLPLMDFVGKLQPGGPTDLAAGLGDYARRAREGGLAVLISDLMDPAGSETGLRALLERGFDVQVIHVMAPEEMDPTFGGDLRLVDAETGESREVTADGEAFRQYQRRLRQFLDRVESFCLEHEISYHRVTTNVALEAFVLRRLKGLLVA